MNQRIKDLPEGTKMKEYKVRTEFGLEGYWFESWEDKVWLTKKPGKGLVIQIPITSRMDIMEWEVLQPPPKRT